MEIQMKNGKPDSVRQKGASSFIYAINPLTWAGNPRLSAYAILQPARFTRAGESLRRW